MDENCAPQWHQTMQHNWKGSGDLYASIPNSDGIASARPGLSPNDLVFNDQFQHFEEQKRSDFGSRDSQRHDYKSGRSSDIISYRDKYDTKDHESQENYEYLKDGTDFNQKYSQNKYLSSNYSTLKSDEYADYSYPLKNHDHKYDTKDTIDRQLEDLKANIRQEEEENKFKANVVSNIGYIKVDDLNLNGMRTFDHESLSHIQDLSNQKLNQTSPHNGQQELSSRIGIMKSAAARMIASNYSKDQESADDGFDSSTNNLITSSKQRVQHIDQVNFDFNK